MLLETRCADNSKCIPKSAVGDGIVDCPDASDELGHKFMAGIQYMKNSFGYINGPANRCFSKSKEPCEWHISQSPGSIITVNVSCKSYRLLP